MCRGGVAPSDKKEANMDMKIGGSYDQFGQSGKIKNAVISAAASSYEFPPFKEELFDGIDHRVLDSVGTRKKIEEAGIQFKTIPEKFAKESSRNGEKIVKNGCSVQYNITILKNKQYIFETVYITPEGKLIKRYNTQTKTTQSEFFNENNIKEETGESVYNPKSGIITRKISVMLLDGKAKAIKIIKTRKGSDEGAGELRMCNSRGELIFKGFGDDNLKYAAYSIYPQAPDKSKRLEFKTVEVENTGNGGKGGEIHITDKKGKIWILALYPIKNQAVINKYLKRGDNYTLLAANEGGKGTGIFVPYLNVGENNFESVVKDAFGCGKDEFEKWYGKLTDTRFPPDFNPIYADTNYEFFKKLHDNI